jgi:predicted nucleic acid-binding protein
MLVLDANILIRAVLGRRVRELRERYAVRGVRFLAPEAAFEEASKCLPRQLEKRGIRRDDVLASLSELRAIVEAVEADFYRRALSNKPGNGCGVATRQIGPSSRQL